MRTTTNVTMNATKKQNSGSRPVWTMRSLNKPSMVAPDVIHPHHDPFRSAITLDVGGTARLERLWADVSR
ncbi:hypothetical protein GCM10029978_023180 [Actinoallomurus acanthiterrae]